MTTNNAQLCEIIYSEVYKQNICGYNDYILNFVKNNSKIWEEKICELIVDNI